MIFTETKLRGAFVIEPEKLEDERGFFARIFDKNEFLKRKMESEFVQSSISKNKKKGTVRGMHFQFPLHEVKIVRCIQGKIFDVIVDLRKNSDTFGESFEIELSDENFKMLYIPKEFAHGFQTLQDNTVVNYDISEFFVPEFSHGFKWNDKKFHIKWPLTPTIISKKDQSYQSFDDKHRVLNE